MLEGRRLFQEVFIVGFLLHPFKLQEMQGEEGHKPESFCYMCT